MRMIPASRSIEGRKLGDFVVRELIGLGGFGAVHRAEQPLLGREAVVKVLHGEHRTSESATQRFLREARLASRLEHPYAAHIYAFGAESDGLLWIAMELVRGTPLDKVLSRQGPMPLARFVPLFDRICEVVENAHSHGIIHRDLKPANVMVLSLAGRLIPKLLDFGIAKGADGIDVAASPVPVPVARRPPPEPDSLADTLSASDRDRPGGDTRPVFATSASTTLGSPHYMAPEQWLDATSAGRRTDLYALGVLAFEALTGKPPFQEPTIAALARAHGEAPVPPVGPTLPPALDEVFRRALAKRPEERHESALELGAALRAAAGLDLGPAPQPRLDEPLRERWLSEAPRPIAEALDVLDSARNVHQAAGALDDVVLVLARWVGLVALASRAHTGERPDAVEAENRLRQLRRGDLGAADWVALARELVRPFAEVPGAFPVPELVACLEGGGGAAFDPLLAGPPRRAGVPEAEARARLEQQLAHLAALLGALSFVRDYALVVPGDELSEHYSGTRRHLRRLRPLAGLPAGRPVLLDPDGAAVIALWPLVQVAEPSPATPPEVFLFHGRGGRGRPGARLVSVPLGFERLDEELWTWFAGALLAEPSHDEESSLGGRQPYPGLATFTTEDAGTFFGRERQVTQFVNRLRITPLLAVVGPSGAGKSSFVQAGVIPALGDDWRVLRTRPGPAPLAALEAVLAAAGLPEGASAGDRLRAAAREQPILLVVDQLEELVTLGTPLAGDDERERYAAALADAARTVEEPVRVVVTFRDDFLLPLERLRGLGERLQHGMQILQTPAAPDLLRIVVEPARRVGYDFDDPTLAAEMVKEVADAPGALALLAFAARRLWELRDRKFHHLLRRAYDAMGGVAGALARHADETLAALSLEDQRLVREVFRRLVTAAGTRAVVSRGELLAVLGGGARAETLVERLIGARLLVSAEGPSREERIEIIHEALLSAWPRLVAWRREDREGAGMRDQLRVAARQWDERGRPRGLLWTDDALVELTRWRERFPGPLGAAEEAFAAASAGRAARAGRVRRALLLAAAIAAVAVAVGLAIAKRRTDRQRDRAESYLSQEYQEQGRRAFLDGNMALALLYLSEAYQRGADGPALRLLLAAARAPLERQLAQLGGATGRVRAVAISPDGARIATAAEDGVGRLYGRDGVLLGELRGHGAALISVAFSPDGGRLVTTSDDGTARLWDGASGAAVATLAGHTGRVLGASFDGTGRRIVTSGLDGTVRVWDAAGGARERYDLGAAPATPPVWRPDGGEIAVGAADGTVALLGGGRQRGIRAHEQYVTAIAYSPDGATLATGCMNGSAALWDAAGGALRAQLVGHHDLITSVAFSPDGAGVLTSGRDDVAILWQRDGRVRAVLRGHSAAVDAARFSADGTRVVTASEDGSATLWDTAGGVPLVSLAGHGGSVLDARFAPDGSWLATASSDGTARLWSARTAVLARPHGARPLALGAAWLTGSAGAAFSSERVATASGDEALLRDAPDGHAIARLAHPRPVVALAFSPDGAILASTCGDHEVRLWRARDGTPMTTLRGDENLLLAVFSPRGTFLAATTTGRGVLLWAVAGWKPLGAVAHDDEVNDAAFSADERGLVTASNDRTARIWDLPGLGQRSILRHNAKVWRASFDPDGARVVTAGEDGAARIWDVGTARLVGTLEGHEAMVTSAAFSEDGAFVVTSSFDGTARVWDPRSQRQLLRLAHPDRVVDAAFTAGGAELVTQIQSGAIEVWPVPREARARGDVAAFARCRVPWRLVDGLPYPAPPGPCSAVR